MGIIWWRFASASVVANVLGWTVGWTLNEWYGWPGPAVFTVGLVINVSTIIGLREWWTGEDERP